MFARLSAAALNHLLMQNSWALPRLAKFSGKTVQFVVSPFSVSCSILPDGMLTDSSETPDAVCDIAPSLLPRIALKDEQAYAQIQTRGDTALLSEIFYLSRNLIWDTADDLSRVTGDIAAERIVQAVKNKRIGAKAANLAEATAEYLTEEHPLLAKPALVNSYMQQVDTLRDDIARLELRIRRLSDAAKTER